MYINIHIFESEAVKRDLVFVCREHILQRTHSHAYLVTDIQIHKSQKHVFLSLSPSLSHTDVHTHVHTRTSIYA